MKIKHWAGYGCVEAKRIPNKSCTLHVRVAGNHEWGLVRNDSYDLYKWLVKRFDRNVPDFLEWNNQLQDIRYVEGETVVNGLDTDTCDYYFTY